MKYKIRIIGILLTIAIFFNAKFSFAYIPISALPGTDTSTLLNQIDVKHLVLDLSFDWHKKQCAGTAFITLSPLITTHIISLDAVKMIIKSVLNDKGQPLQFEYDGSLKGNNLKITLDRKYTRSEKIVLNISYITNHINEPDPNLLGGSFGQGLRFFQPTKAEPRKRKQIWSQGEPENNRYWFPCHDVLDDLRTTEIKATLEKPLMLISNGKLIETIEHSNGSRTFHYRSDTPYPNYLTSIVIGEYSILKQNFGNIPLQTFCYPDEIQAAQASIDRLPDMVKFMTEKTGHTFPFAQYNQIVVQDYPFPGLTGQHTASILSDNFVDDYRTHKDFLYLWDGVETQALAAQWFGNLLTPQSWEHIWLNQSFCHYFAGLYTDYKNGHDEYLTWYFRPLEQAAVLGDWATGYKHPIVTKNFTDLTVFSSDNYIKFRGTLVLRMLRKELGEETWWKAIKQYVKTNAFKQVTTEDFQKSIEAITGTSIRWFFDQWIYKMGLPVFDIEKKYDETNKQLVLTVIQSQKIDSHATHPQVDFFRGKMEIEIDDRIEKIILKAKEKNVYTFPLSQEPRLIHFNFESTWIGEVHFSKTLNEYLYQVENDKDILGKMGAIDSLVKIAKDENTSTVDREKIFTSFRKVLSGNSYWRLKNYVLGYLRSLQGTQLNKETISALLKLIENSEPWIKTSAISLLGMTADSLYTDVYLRELNDSSDRVINAAAIALGKTKSYNAYNALIKLATKPSWKSQSLISALNGLKELGDPRGADLALKSLADLTLPRWWLAVPTWDYPVTAAQTLVSLGKGHEGYPILYEQYKNTKENNDINDIFFNIQLLSILGDSRGQIVFDELKIKYKDEASVLSALSQFETQFKENIKK